MPHAPTAPATRSSKLEELFGIDPRTLAFSRMAISAVLLLNLASRAVELRTMYSDDGLFPIADVGQFWGIDSWRWSLHMLNGSTAYQAVLFGLAAFCAMLLFAGLLTRLSTIASWALLMSLHTRAPVLVTGGDVLLLMLLFWGMFLPWGKRASVDAWLNAAPRDTTPVLSVASAAILLQVAFMYWFTGFSKCNYLWFEGRALESVFLNPLFSRPLGAWLVQFSGTLTGLTYLTLVLELVGPLLMFSPWRTNLLRTSVVGSFVLLHIGIELTMYVVIFTYASLAALTLFTPRHLWESPLLQRFVPWLPRRIGSPTSSPSPTPRNWLARGVHTFVASVCLVALAYVLIVNPLVYFGGPHLQKHLPQAVWRIDEVAGLAQQWSMFACPANHNYRYAAVAHLRNGSQVDVLRNCEFQGDERPEELSLEVPTQRWVQIMVDLARSHRSVFRQSFIRYLARQWNEQHPLEEQIEHIQLALLHEKPQVGDVHSPIERLVLAQYDPFARGTYQQGKRQGRWVFFYPHGQLEAVGDYCDGKEHGHWTLFYEDGRKQGEGDYVNGQMAGKWVFWYADGQQLEANYHQGQVVPRPLPSPEDDTAGD